MARVMAMAVPHTPRGDASSGSRRGLITARLGSRRVLVTAGDETVQASADEGLALGEEVLVVDWAGGAMALPLGTLGGAMAGDLEETELGTPGQATNVEVMCDHGIT